MSVTLLIGAKTDNTDLIAKLATSQFPLAIKLTNHLPRNLSLPEAHLFLSPLHGKGEAMIKSFADLTRLISSLEQIAFLNNHDHAVTLDDLTPDAVVVPVAAPAPAPVVKEPAKPKLEPKIEPKGEN